MNAKDLADQAAELRAKLASLPSRTEKASGRPHVIAIASGKGGVGKSHVAINLAYHLSRLGKKALLLDADFGLGNTDILLGVHAERNLSDVVAGRCHVRDIAISLSEKMTILPAGSAKYSLANANSLILENLLYDIEQFASRYEYLVIDTGAGLREQVRDTLLIADQIAIVTTPDPASLTDSYATIKMMHQRDPKKQFNVIVNMVKNAREGEAVFQQIALVAKKYLDLRMTYWGCVPRDKRVVETIRSQKMISQAYPGSAASLALRQIAAQAVGQGWVDENTSLSQMVGQFFGRLMVKQGRQGLAIEV